MKKNSEQLPKDHSQKLLTALSASREALFQTVLATDQDVLSAALKNPHLHEEHLLVLLKRTDLSEDLVSKIYKRFSSSLSHQLCLALAKNPAVSDNTFRKLLPLLHLFELVDICFLPGMNSDRRVAAERNILQRLPTTPLGNKLTLARRGTTNIVAELLKEGQPTLTEICLQSPRLKEAAIYRFINSSRASGETISMVARNQRWQHRPNLQLAILKNPRTPNIWFTLWLPKLSLPVLKQLLVGQRLKGQKQQLVKQELRRRGIS